MTDYFGTRGGEHKGIDVGAPLGTVIYSPMDGTCIDARSGVSGFGNWVRVQHEGVITVYGHVNEWLVNKGDKVTAGQPIAKVGSEGHSTGPHLHFEVRTTHGGNEEGIPTNPEPWCKQHGISYH